MRLENTQITLNMYIPIGTPDCNNVIFTKEAIEQAITHLNKNIPIIYNDTESESTAKVIGMTTGDNYNVEWNSDNQVCKLTIDGIIFYSGARIVVHELEDNNITSCDIVGFGLTV